MYHFEKFNQIETDINLIVDKFDMLDSDKKFQYNVIVGDTDQKIFQFNGKN